MKSVLTCLALLTVSALLAPAQPHPGGIVFHNPDSSRTRSGVYVADRTTNGVWSTLFTPSATYNPASWTQAVMGPDNRTIVHGTVGTRGLQDHGVFAYDPTTGAVTTIASDATAFGTPTAGLGGAGYTEGAHGVIVDQDGNYLIASNNGLYLADGSGAFTTLRTVPSPAHLVKDATTGDVVYFEYSTSPFFARSPVTALRLSNDNISTTVQSLGSEALFTDQSNKWVQQLSTGDFLHPFGTGFRVPLLRFNPTQGPTTLTTIDVLGNLYATMAGANRCAFENQSQANPQLLVYGTESNQDTISAKILSLDPQNSWAVTNTNVLEKKIYLGTSDYFRTSGVLFNDRANYIQTVKTGVCTWDIKLSAPTYGGKNYALIAGASGYWPGVSIDSRRIMINPDVLAWATAYNLIPSVFNPGPMVLDANGAATGTIDLTGLNLPAGTRFLTHMVLLVLDKAAPNGIAFITEPECFKIIK